MHNSAATALLLAASTTLTTATYTFDPLEHLAGIAPYFTPNSPPFSPAAPQGCNVTRAAYLVRHAAIYANDFDFESYIEPFVDKIVASQNSSSNSSIDWTASPVLSFLASWKSPINEDEEEKLTKIGKLEAFKLGIDVGERYPGLAQPPKVWSSTAERTVKSAQSFIDGLALKSNVTQLVEVSEAEEQGADSLTPYEGCPAYSSSRGSSQSEVSPPVLPACSSHAVLAFFSTPLC